MEQLTFTEPRVQGPRRPGRLAYYGTMTLHIGLGLLWALVIAGATGIRDLCFSESCPPPTPSQTHTEGLVWLLGGTTWVALFVLVVLSAGEKRLYWALCLVPVWFVVAAAWGGSAIVGSAA